MTPRTGLRVRCSAEDALCRALSRTSTSQPGAARSAGAGAAPGGDGSEGAQGRQRDAGRQRHRCHLRAGGEGWCWARAVALACLRGWGPRDSSAPEGSEGGCWEETSTADTVVRFEFMGEAGWDGLGGPGCGRSTLSWGGRRRVLAGWGPAQQGLSFRGAFAREDVSAHPGGVESSYGAPAQGCQCWQVTQTCP